jgi:uncharacterized protein YjbI with pentapeptide repeats
MAHPLHLARLREGTETWNSWRHTHPPMVADFSEAQLEHLNFDHAHLIGADLSQATLHGADLSGADFHNACLWVTYFTGALHSKATFRWSGLQAIDPGDVNVHAARLV